MSILADARISVTVRKGAALVCVMQINRGVINHPGMVPADIADAIFREILDGKREGVIRNGGPEFRWNRNRILAAGTG